MISSKDLFGKKATIVYKGVDLGITSDDVFTATMFTHISDQDYIEHYYQLVIQDMRDKKIDIIIDRY